MYDFDRFWYNQNKYRGTPDREKMAVNMERWLNRLYEYNFLSIVRWSYPPDSNFRRAAEWSEWFVDHHIRKSSNATTKLYTIHVWNFTKNLPTSQQALMKSDDYHVSPPMASLANQLTWNVLLNNVTAILPTDPALRSFFRLEFDPVCLIKQKNYTWGIPWSPISGQYSEVCTYDPAYFRYFVQFLRYF